MYVSLYGDRGALVGWVTFANEAGNDLSGGSMDQAPPGGGTALLRWFHEPVCGGWVALCPPPAGGRVLDWTNGMVIIGGGNLAIPLTNHVTIGPDNQAMVSDGPINSLILTIQRTSGLFKGSICSPSHWNECEFGGVILQKQNRGGRLFPGRSRERLCLHRRNSKAASAHTHFTTSDFLSNCPFAVAKNALLIPPSQRSGRPLEGVQRNCLVR